MRLSDTVVVIVGVRVSGRGGEGWGWCEGWGCMPLLTRPQRYCDPASLVYLAHMYSAIISNSICYREPAKFVGNVVDQRKYHIKNKKIPSLNSTL